MKYLRTCSSMATLLLIQASALAAEEAAHGDSGHAQGSVQDINLWQFGTAIAVFLIAFFVLSRTAWPKISKGLSDRENKIRGEIEAAEKARKAADTALKEYERSLSEARSEAQRMIDQVKADQLRIAAENKARAEEEIVKMRESALRSIDAAKRAAVNDLYNEAASLATTVASRILQREVNEQDQRRLVEDSIAEFTRDYARS